MDRAVWPVSKRKRLIEHRNEVAATLTRVDPRRQAGRNYRNEDFNVSGQLAISLRRDRHEGRDRSDYAVDITSEGIGNARHGSRKSRAAAIRNDRSLSFFVCSADAWPFVAACHHGKRLRNDGPGNLA